MPVMTWPVLAVRMFWTLQISTSSCLAQALNQPFYHLLAENSETEYIAYVSEQNLLEDDTGEPVRHPQINELFDRGPDGQYAPVMARH